MKNLREFAIEQENERLREMAFQEWALPRIKENFGLSGYDMVLRKEFDKEHCDSMGEIFWEKFLEQKK